MLPFKYFPGVASIMGVRYEVANDVQIPNLGEHKLELCTGSMQRRILLFQVCDVHKCLMSTAKLNEAGQRVVLYEQESYIEDRSTGDCIKVEYKDRVYFLKVWVRQTSGGEIQAVTGQEAERTATCQANTKASNKERNNDNEGHDT